MMNTTWMARLSAFGTVLVLLLGAWSPAAARSAAPSDEAGSFDYYLLSLSVAPSFCALSLVNRSRGECRTLDDADYRETPLTVHGLWPNRARVSVNRQPHDCSTERAGRPGDSLDALLRRYMPGGPGLRAYEWRKHGTCSGLSSQAYFETLVRLAHDADVTIGAILRDQGLLGHDVRVSDLIAAVATKDPALARAIVVDCKFPRASMGQRDMGQSRALIDEIRLTLSKRFLPIPAESVGFGQNSGCPGGVGFLPAATGLAP